MMKRMVSLALALILCLSLAACGGQNNAAGSDAGGTDSTAGGEQNSGGGQAAEESDVAYIQDKGTLVVGITEFAPMDYQDENGEWIGFDADMARKVAEALGVEVEFSVIDWNNKLMELEGRTVDCLWNGMTITDEITGGASATNPYATNAQVVVLKSGIAGDYQTVESLAELNFAVEAGSAGEAAAQEAGLTCVSVSDQATALMEVNSGTSDACIVDLLMAGAMIGEGTSHDNLVHTVELTTEEYGVGFRKGSDLAAALNEFLAAAYADGSLMACAETYGVQDAIIAQ